MEKEIRVLEETNNDILNIVETKRNKYGSLNIKNEHLEISRSHVTCVTHVIHNIEIQSSDTSLPLDISQI